MQLLEATPIVSGRVGYMGEEAIPTIGDITPTWEDSSLVCEELLKKELKVEIIS